MIGQSPSLTRNNKRDTKYCNKHIKYNNILFKLFKYDKNSILVLNEMLFSSLSDESLFLTTDNIII